MRVTLYNPKTGYDSVTHIPRMPLGLISIAAAAASKSHEITVVDDDLRCDDDGFAERVIATEPEIVGLTTWLGGLPDIAHLRKILPQKVPIVVGGALASVIPEYHLEQGADVVVIGNGQASFLEVLSDLDCIEGYGLAKMRNRRIYRQGRKADDWIRFCSGYEHFNMEEYVSRWPGGKRGAMVATAKGCPYKCPFCNPGYRGTYAERRAWDVWMEVAHLQQRYGVEELYLADATFTYNVEHTKNVCGVLRRDRIRWFCETRADCLDEMKCRIMKESGCYLVLLGLESASNQINEDLRGGKGREKTERAVKMLRDAGIEVGVFVLFGLPGETNASIEETLAFIEKLGVKASPNVLFPIPGTPIWDLAQERQLLPPLGEYLRRLNEYNKLSRAYVAVPGLCTASEEAIIQAVRSVWEHNESMGGF